MNCLAIVTQSKDDAATMQLVQLLTQLQGHLGLTQPTAEDMLEMCASTMHSLQIPSDSDWNLPFSLPLPHQWVNDSEQTSRESLVATFLAGLTSSDKWLYSGQTRCALCCLSALLNVSPSSFLLIESKRSDGLKDEGEDARRAFPQGKAGSANEQQPSTSGLNNEGATKEGGSEANSSGKGAESTDDWAGFALGTAAAVAGGSLVLLTAGLAAPFLAAIGGAFVGAIPVAGPLIAPVVTSSVSVGAITGGLALYGAHAASSAVILLGSVEQYGFLDLDAVKEKEEAWEKLPDLEAILMHRDNPGDTSTAVMEHCTNPAACPSGDLSHSTQEQPMSSPDEEVRDLFSDLLPVLPLNLLPSPQRSRSSLKLAICVSGFVSASSSSELCQPWSSAFASHASSCDRFILLFDVQILRAVAWTESQFAKEEAVSGVVTMATLAIPSLWPIGILRLVGGLSSPWMSALRRSKEAGIMLGRQLAQKQKTKPRPTTLLGFSLGARVVFFALVELSRLGVRDAVESAVLMGAPVEVNDAEEWKAARGVVVGRLVNAFSPTDLTLSLVHRYKTLDVVSVVAGLGPVLHVQGVENRDVSDLINSHDDYEDKIPSILERLKFC